MSDPLRPRVYRPYSKSRILGLSLIAANLAINAHLYRIAVTDPEGLEAATRGKPAEFWYVIAICNVALMAWFILAAIIWPNAIEITEDEIIMRHPSESQSRVPLTAITGIEYGALGWARVPILLWKDGGEIKKFYLPLYRADDGTLLEEVAPALVEALARLPGFPGDPVGSNPP